MAVRRRRRAHYVMLYADTGEVGSGFGDRKQIAAISKLVSTKGIGVGRPTCLAKLADKPGQRSDYQKTNICFRNGRQISGPKISFKGAR